MNNAPDARELLTRLEVAMRGEHRESIYGIVDDAAAWLRAYLAAVPAPPAGPPREPTREMIDAARYLYFTDPESVWRAMYDAAPAAEPREPDAWVYKYVGRDPYPAICGPVVRGPDELQGKTLDELYPGVWERVRPLYAAPAAEPVAQPERETCWLIERWQAEGQEQTIWWVGPEWHHDEKYFGTWTETALKAKRFATREEAERYAAGADGPGHIYRATEHVFIGEPVAQQPPPHGERCPIGIPHCERCVDEKVAAQQPEAPTLAAKLAFPLRYVTVQDVERERADAKRIRVLEAENALLRNPSPTADLGWEAINAIAASRERERAAYERAAITAWNAGMDWHKQSKRFDARELGSACARAIRALAAPDSAAEQEKGP